MSNHALPDSFLWGGATAASQFEGGYLEGGDLAASPSSWQKEMRT